MFRWFKNRVSRDMKITHQQPIDKFVGLDISFQPVGDGAPSFGTTNSEGKYSLQMTPRLKGASPGENLVSVNIQVTEYAEGEEEPANDTPSFKILKEFRDGTHKVTVSKGQNTIDLEVAAE